jgi:hypothetical protein
VKYPNSKEAFGPGMAGQPGMGERRLFPTAAWADVLPESYKEFWPISFSLSTRN